VFNKKTVIKIIISIALLVAVYGKANLYGIFQTIEKVSINSVILLSVLYGIGQILSSLKWRIFVKESGLERSTIDVFRAYFFGMFINSFGFGTVGGDLARALALKPEKGKRAITAATVVADRIHGLSVLLTIGGCAIFIVKPEVLGPYAPILSLALILMLIVGWFIGPIIVLKLLPHSFKLRPLLEDVLKAFPRKFKPFMISTLLSVGVHTLQISMTILMSVEVGANVPIGHLFSAIPIVNAVSSLPISIQGIGVREKMYEIFFIPLGVTQEQIVTMGAIWLVTITLVSAVGGLILTPDLVFQMFKSNKSKSGTECDTSKDTSGG
jgi:uncharacterized membrane protein YbhN (UPF0104 family)